MNSKEFNLTMDGLLERCKETLQHKAGEYADSRDRLHNFNSAAELIGGTKAQACWGMAVKHVVSVSDMVASGQSYPMPIWDEKLGDMLNYCILLYACVVEKESKNADLQ